MAQMADVVAASPAVTEERLDAQVLDAALGEESDAAADVEMPLDRTASQLDVYHRLEAVLRRVADRRAPIQELARSVRRLGEDAQKALGQKDSSLLREVAGGVEKVRKLARNFGEDLLEDMLAMDKLSGFAQADRSRRKAAIAEIEGMLDQVDLAKARLVALGKELSASLEALTKEEEQEEVKDEDGDEAMEEASPRPDAASGARPARAPPTLAPVPAPAREAVAAAGAAGAEAAAGVRLQPPGRELWQQVALPVRFRAHEDRTCYALLARVPGLDLKDVRLKVPGDQSALTVTGCRIPSSRQAAQMQQNLAARLQRLRQSSPARFHQISDQLAEVAGEAYAEMGQGEFGRFSESFHIPHDVDARGIQSSYEDGILCITLPKRSARADLGHRACGSSVGMPQHPFFW